ATVPWRRLEGRRHAPRGRAGDGSEHLRGYTGPRIRPAVDARVAGDEREGHEAERGVVGGVPAPERCPVAEDAGERGTHDPEVIEQESADDRDRENDRVPDEQRRERGDG